MTRPPVDDGDVVAFWQALGLPGLVDAHVHFMPDRVMQKVWSYFDAAGPLTGRRWPIRYRWDDERRLAHLRALGVRAFPSLLYPHKAGMAEWLNSWAAEFAAANPDVVATGTFFPEPTAPAYVAAAIAAGVRVFKAHVQVGGYDPRDALLDPVWGLLAEAGTPVVVHAGHGPAPGRWTGPEVFGTVLERHPRLRAVIAHLGMPDYDAFLGFAETYEHVAVDTTMCFVDFFGEQDDLGRRLAPRLTDLAEKVLFGSDFPNIPHAYAHQIEALVRLDLGDDWLRSVLWHNGARLFGLARSA